jgi:hypothetical protein
MTFNEAVNNILSVAAINRAALDSENDYHNFVNSVPGIENCKDPRALYTFHAQAAKIARSEKLTNEFNKHYSIARRLKDKVMA